jgi:RNA polymerase sigma-70 factor (ECF subfamily)
MVRTLPRAFDDEASFVAALVDRQPAAAAAAWDRFAPLVRGLLWQALGVGSDVEDLTQDVFLTFFRRIGDLRDPNAVSSFLVSIAIRVARNELRRRRLRRWLSLSDDGELPERSAPTVDGDAREALARLYAILDRLDSDTRLAFVLRFVRGMELTEVATALGCSLATAKRRIAKASERIALHARGDVSLAPYLAAGAAPEAAPVSPRQGSEAAS